MIEVLAKDRWDQAQVERRSETSGHDGEDISHSQELLTPKPTSLNSPDQNLSRRIAFHSENGPGIGGSDLLLGTIADSLDASQWERFALTCTNYPREKVFRRSPLPSSLTDGLAANSAQPAAHEDPRNTDAAQRNDMGRLGRAGAWQRMRTALARALPFVARRMLGYRRAAVRTANLLRRHRVCVFQTMDGGPQPTVVGAKSAGCKVVSVYSAPPPSNENGGRFTRYYARVSCQHADVCIAMSAHTAAEWTSYLDIERGRFEVVYNGVDAAVFRQADGSRLREQLGISPTAVVIGMTGRMEPEKGPLVLAEAAGQLAPQFPDVYWLFVGTGSEEQPLRRQLHDMGLSQRCRVLGFRSDIPELTAAYDIAMVPSLFQEPFGLVVAEAMAAGKPVVASRVGGIPEIVKDGETGVLVPAGDPAGIARVVAMLLRNPDMRRQMGLAGQQRVDQLFTRSRMIAQYLRIYEQLLAT